MFPPASDSDRHTPRSLRAALRNAADLAVAFMTLESYGLDDLRPGRSTRPDDLTTGPADDAALRPGVFPDARAAAGPSSHTHRRELRAPSRTRRPGAVVLREQPCTTPLLAPDNTAPVLTSPPRRRTALQDTAAS